jgi:hypothetical protein
MSSHVLASCDVSPTNSLHQGLGWYPYCLSAVCACKVEEWGSAVQHTECAVKFCCPWASALRFQRVELGLGLEHRQHLAKGVCRTTATPSALCRWNNTHVCDHAPLILLILFAGETVAEPLGTPHQKETALSAGSDVDFHLGQGRHLQQSSGGGSFLTMTNTLVSVFVCCCSCQG